MKTIIALVGMLALVGCATLGKREFKDSTAYNKDFKQVWKVCMDAVSDQVIDRADKDVHQITTKPVKTRALMGAGDEVERYVTIKISDEKPYKVSVMVTAARMTTATAGMRTLSSTDTFSDETEEHRILSLIDAKLR